MSAAQCSVSVVVVSDYGGRTAEDWNYLRDTLSALGQQAFDDGVEVLLVDSTPAGQEMPRDLTSLVPALRVIGGSAETSRELLNTAFRAAAGDFVALLDGDCAPAPGWLRAAVGLAADSTWYPKYSVAALRSRKV